MSLERAQEKPQMTKDQNGNFQYIFSAEHVKIWEEKGIMPKDLVNYFFEKLKKTHEEHIKVQEFKKTHPESTEEALNVFLHEQLGEESQQDTEMSSKFHDFLYNHWKSLLLNLEEKQEKEAIFENVTDDEQIGIVRLITDSIYHLNKLMNGASLERIYENIYEAKSEIKNSKGEGISLVFSFPASCDEEADKIFEDYKQIMTNKGLKIWMAHWGLANERGKTEYSCPMTEIMRMLSDDGRKAHFSVKEKQEHWAITKMLGMTKVLREHTVRKKGTKTLVTRWMEQPLLEILGGEKATETQNKYPELIAVRVLAPQPDMKGFVPAIYNKETYRLHPSDVYLAFAIQTRAAQRNRGDAQLRFDWKFLFEFGNLEGTAQSNQRMAKAITRKKMNRFRQKEIIEDWNEDVSGMRITPKTQKKSDLTEIIG